MIMIFAAEFGDRSFMLIILHTMKYNKWKVFVPSVITMLLLHLMSVGFGKIVLLLFHKIIVIYFSIALFIFFGLLMFYEAYHIDPKSAKERLDNTESLLNKEELESSPSSKNCWLGYFKGPYCRLIFLLFLAEWGDRCQVGAIILTATNNIWGVAIGGAIGMGFCCILASFLGYLAADRISERLTTIIGGCLFLFFAIQTTYSEILYEYF